jgi:hypothetical protein
MGEVMKHEQIADEHLKWAINYKEEEDEIHDTRRTNRESQTEGDTMGNAQHGENDPV